MLKRLKALLMWGDPSPRARRHRLFCLACALIMLACIAYAASYFAEESRVRREGETYRAMYSPAPLDTEAPAATASPTPTQAATPTQGATATPTTIPTPDATATPAPTAAPTASPTPTPLPLVEDVPLPTPNEDTIVFSLPTEPPPQESFAELLRYNQDTVGFLTIGETVDLPVVQRENDNEYYLTHAYSGEEAREGALFLDGANRLSDENLIVYGHNMRNGTMFGELSSFGEREFLRENAVVRFDTLYENALYVPFAMFEASMDENDGHYFDVRQIVFDETSFELFVLKLRGRSVFDVPVEVEYGDQLLTLVTCSYNDDDGRYIVALRKLREGETEEEMRALMERVE